MGEWKEKHKTKQKKISKGWASKPFHGRENPNNEEKHQENKSETEVLKDYVPWEQCWDNARSTRSPGGLRPNVNEKVELWKEHFADHSHLSGYYHTTPCSTA